MGMSRSCAGEATCPARVRVALVEVVVFLVSAILIADAAQAQGVAAANSFKNKSGMEFAYIPAGDFLMGAAANDGEAEDDEKPQHKVKISRPFYLGVREVSQAEYEEVMHENPSSKRGSALPVEGVTWFKAQEFCDKLGRLDGNRYRLPTEAEWEYACRAGTIENRPFPANPAVLKQHAWYVDNFTDKTFPVGTLQPNKWKLYDILGNVAEWCQDDYDRNLYAGRAAHAPVTDPVAVLANKTIGTKVVRGGNFTTPRRYLRSSYRGSNSPSASSEKVGLRIVCEPSAQLAEVPTPGKLPQRGNRPVPNDNARQQAKSRLQQVYGEKIAQAEKNAKQVEPTVNQLQADAMDPATNPAMQYVLLQEARRLSVILRDVDLHAKIVNLLVSTFNVDGFEILAHDYQSFGGKAPTLELRRKLTDALLLATEEAIAADNYKTAKVFAVLAVNSTTNSERQRPGRQAEARVAELATAFDALQPHRETLLVSPDDPQANLEVGKFYALLKRDWERGLRCLLKSGDAAWRDLAHRDQAARLNPQTRKDLGDSYWQLAEKQDHDYEANSLRYRAVHWYQQVIASLTGFDKSEVDQRINEWEK